MRNKINLILFILSIPVMLVAAFILFWITLGLAVVEFIITIPLSWFEVADGKFLTPDAEEESETKETEKSKTKKEAG